MSDPSWLHQWSSNNQAMKLCSRTKLPIQFLDLLKSIRTICLQEIFKNPNPKTLHHLSTKIWIKLREQDKQYKIQKMKYAFKCLTMKTIKAITEESTASMHLELKRYQIMIKMTWLRWTSLKCTSLMHSNSPKNNSQAALLEKRRTANTMNQTI